MMNFSEETLTAYVDSELDSPTRAALEQAIASDPELADRIARHRTLRQTLQSAYASVLDAPVPEQLLAAARMAAGRGSASEGSARSTGIPLRSARARLLQRWTSIEWTALAASLILGAILSLTAYRQFNESPVSASGGRLVASGALANALSNQLASRQAPDAPVAIGVTFVSKSGDYCRTFALRRRGNLAGLACHSGGAWQIEVIAKGESHPRPNGPYRQAAATIPPALVETVEIEMAGDPLDARAEATARSENWGRR